MNLAARLIWSIMASCFFAGPALCAEEAKQPFKPEELEQIVAPIALYPDSLLAQVFMASTYPLEIVQAARWQKANPKVAGKALEDAMQKQRWDASVKSLTAMPQVLEMLDHTADFVVAVGRIGGEDFNLADKELLLDRT